MDFTSKPVEQTTFSHPIPLRSLLILSASLSLRSPSCFLIKRTYALISLAHPICSTLSCSLIKENNAQEGDEGRGGGRRERGGEINGGVLSTEHYANTFFKF